MDHRRRIIWLGSALGVLALINAAWLAGAFSDRAMDAHWRVLAHSADAEGDYLILQFALSERRSIRSIAVEHLPGADADAGGAPRTVWALEGASDPMDTFTLGATITGMQRSDGGDGRPRLRPGGRYRLTVRAAGFRHAELDFEL